MYTAHYAQHNFLAAWLHDIARFWLSCRCTICYSAEPIKDKTAVEAPASAAAAAEELPRVPLMRDDSVEHGFGLNVFDDDTIGTQNVFIWMLNF